MAKSFYTQFLIELDKVTVKANAPAAAVVWECIRAAKRAEMVLNGETVSDGPFVCEPFFGEHLCSICFGWVHEHDERCGEGEDRDWHRHTPPLCCPGCPCGSFEEAHPTMAVV